MFHKNGRNSDPKMHGTSARCRKPKPTAEEPGGPRKTWIRAARDPVVTTGRPCMAAARRRHGAFPCHVPVRHFRSGAACPSRASLTVTGVVMTASYYRTPSHEGRPRILLGAADRGAYRRRTGPRRRSDPQPRATQPLTRRAVVPARRPSSPAARSHRCAPTQRPPSGAIMITPTFRPKSGADRWSVTSLAGRMVAIVNLGRWVSRLDGRERLEDLVGVHSVPGNDPAVAWLE